MNFSSSQLTMWISPPPWNSSLLVSPLFVKWRHLPRFSLESCPFIILLGGSLYCTEFRHLATFQAFFASHLYIQPTLWPHFTYGSNWLMVPFAILSSLSRIFAPLFHFVWRMPTHWSGPALNSNPLHNRPCISHHHLLSRDHCYSSSFHSSSQPVITFNVEASF